MVRKKGERVVFGSLERDGLLVGGRIGVFCRKGVIFGVWFC